MARAQATRQSDHTAAGRRIWPWILGLLVVLAIVLIVLRPSEGPSPEQSAETAVQPASGRVIRDTEPAQPPARPGDTARALIAQARAAGKPYDLASLAERARAFQTEGAVTDAYLLYFFTAREGHAPSALILGTLVDPVHFEREGNLMDEPDPVQALKWYRKAAQGGEAEATARLASLHDWAEARAQDGDETAQRLLLAWQ